MDKKKNSNEILFRDGSLIPVTENLVLCAVWVPEEESYTVSFDLQGGLNNGMPEKLSCLPGQSVLLPPLSNTFKEVFEGKDVTYRSSTVNKATFNSVITKALENRKIISIDITSYGAHVITVWGASYGNDGFIQGLYLTDSAVSNEIYGVDAGGLQYSEVVYQNGKPFVYYNGGNNSAPVVTLYTFSSCQDIWSIY